MEKELAIKDFNSFTIHGWMRTKLNLSGNALMIYSIIFCFSQDNKSAFYGTRQYLSDFIGASRPTVDKALNELCDLGYIIKESVEIKNVVFNNFKINFDILNDVKKYDTYKETLQGCKETLHNDNKTYNKENNFNNINNNIDSKKEIEKEKSGFLEGYDENGEYHSFFENDDNFKEKSKPEENPKTDVEKVFDYYVMKSKFYGYVKKNLKMSNITLNNITKYLKEYSITYIEQTIDRYFQVITDKNYFFNTYWFPEKFFKQHNTFNDFTEEGEKWINYNLARNKVNPYKS